LSAPRLFCGRPRPRRFFFRSDIFAWFQETQLSCLPPTNNSPSPSWPQPIVAITKPQRKHPSSLQQFLRRARSTTRVDAPLLVAPAPPLARSLASEPALHLRLASPPARTSIAHSLLHALPHSHKPQRASRSSLSFSRTRARASTHDPADVFRRSFFWLARSAPCRSALKAPRSGPVRNGVSPREPWCTGRKAESARARLREQQRRRGGAPSSPSFFVFSPPRGLPKKAATMGRKKIKIERIMDERNRQVRT